MGDPAAFSRLLERLRADDPTPDQAYERLRFRLITYLRVRVPNEADAEALADTALDRLARRLHEGTTVESVPQYALGIARLLVKEAEARAVSERKRGAAFAYEQTATTPAADDYEGDKAQAVVMQALSACLEGLGAETRDLVLAYYGSDGPSRIASRHALAARLGIAPNALRNRALRARMRLEACVKTRLERARQSGVIHPGETSLSAGTRMERSK